MDTFEEKSPIQPPPWGRLSRRTRENAVIWAHTVSDPLGWRRKNAQKESRRSGPLVGLTGIPGRVPTGARATDARLTGPTRPP